MDDLRGRCDVISWEAVHGLSKRLARMIRDSGFQPDMIIGLARGGWVPARNLCDLLGVGDLISIKMEHWGDTATMDGSARMKYPVETDLTGKRILIVDDCADSGESLHVAKEYVKTLNPKQVKTATMQTFDSTPENRLPDFYAERLPWRWIIYPWNYTEDVINLMKRMIEHHEKMHCDEVHRGLETHFDIRIDRDVVRELLEEAERRRKLKRHDSGADYWTKM